MANGTEGERHPAGDAWESTPRTPTGAPSTGTDASDRGRTAKAAGKPTGAGPSDVARASSGTSPSGGTGPPSGTGPSSVDGAARTTRRSLLRAGALASAGTLGLGGTASAEHNDASEPDREVDGDSCLDGFGAGGLSAGDADIMLNNWATRDCNDAPVEMCVSTYGDGSFGWEWSRGHTCEHGNDLPNYPQALMGSKIGGTSSGWGGLPEQVSNVDGWDVQLDVEQNRSDGEWNFMMEWWMDRGSISSDPTDEIAIVLERSEEHTKGGTVVDAAIEDDYGNVVDYWANDVVGGDGGTWNFHIFRIAANEVPSHVDLRSVLDYLIEDPEGEVADGGGSYDGSKLVSGVEIGNENWDYTDGDTTVNQFNVRVQTTDGQEQVGTAGVENSWSEPDNLAPSAPTDLSVTGIDQSSISLDWSAASDPDGNVDHYEVTETGTGATTTATGTNATVDGLDSGVGYQFTVAAVDDEGATSPPSDSVAATTVDGLPAPCEGAEGGSVTVDGQVVCDVNDDGYYRDVTGDGSVGQGDVAEFFTKQHRSAWKQPDMFDFSENGAVTHGDVVELFDYVALNT